MLIISLSLTLTGCGSGSRFALGPGSGYETTEDNVSQIEDNSVASLKENVISQYGGEVRVSMESEFTFSPDWSGTWVIYTSDNNCDPLLKLYSSGGIYITEDDDSAGDSNSLIVLYLDSEETYKISAEYFDEIVGEYTIIVEPAEQFPDDNLSVVVSKPSGFEFVVLQTGIWVFQTSNNMDTDPILAIFDSTGNLVAYDDDSGAGFNARISTNVRAGTIYVLIRRPRNAALARSGEYILAAVLE